MRDERWGEPWDVDADNAQAPPRSIAPGKRTLTMRLPSGNARQSLDDKVAAGKRTTTIGSHLQRTDAAPAPVQRTRDPAAGTAHGDGDTLTARWTGVAMRPDLHPGPLDPTGKGHARLGHEATNAPPGSRRVTEEDVAAATVASKDHGAPATPEIRAAVEGALGVRIPEAMVHQDETAQAGAAAMGARAFAHGADVFLGPGESDDDPHLMAHELTHVAQQAGASPGVQGKLEVGASNTPAEHQADEVAEAVTSGGVTGAVLCDDDAPSLAPGQMHKRDFIALLEPQLTAAAAEELGPLWSAAGCPYIEKYLAAYAQRPARDAEAFVRRFTRSNAATAAALIPDIIARVRAGVRYWRDTGNPPPEVAAADPEAAQAATIAAQGGPMAPHGSAQRMPRDGGQTLDPRVASAAAETMGAPVGDVRVHTGAAADRLAREQGALAVAMGSDIAFAGGAYRPGTPAGDILIAHELAHAAQQGDAARTGSPAERDRGDEAADEADADRAAGGVFRRLWSRFFGRGADKTAPARRSGLALRRCSGGNQPARAMDRSRYAAIELRLRDLVARKKQLVEGAGGDMAEIDAELDELIAELRVDFGVRMDKGKILDMAVARMDMLVVDGRVVVSPSGSAHYFGERLGFKLELDHVPPGETVDIGWRWRTSGSGNGYRFLINGPAFAEKTRSQEMELDTPFWGLVPPAIDKAGGMEVLAHVYVGSVSKPSKTFSTGFIPTPRKPVGDIHVVGAPGRVVAGQYLDLGIGPWTPDFHGHSIDWYVDDALVAEDQLGLRRQFSDVGAHAVRADVHTVRRSFGVHDKKLVKSAHARFDVLTSERFGTAFLDELDASPFRPEPVGLGEVVTSGNASLAEIEHRIDQGGSQQPYWEDRKEAQKERLEKIEELAPDHATAKPLPADPSKLEPGSYSAPITAALVMAEHGGAQPLTVHLTIRGKDGAWTARLIDSTSRKVLKYDGEGATPLDAYHSVFGDWQADNDYPTGGRIVHRFAPSGWTKGNGFETYTPWKRAKEWVDGIIMVGGFIVGALLLASPDPTISKALGAILMAVVVARSSIAIYERIDTGGDVMSSENILDAVAIVTSFVGMGGSVLRASGLKAIDPTTYRAGNWMILGAVAGDAGTFVYVSAEAMAQLKVIQSDPTLDSGHRATETMRIMASLFLTGAMLIATNKELLRSGLQPTDFIQSKLKPGAKPELDVGARLDAEYELKQAGRWRKETSKLSDEALLDQVFTNRSRKELEASLAKRVGDKPARALADALDNDAFVKLSTAVGEDRMAALARDVGAVKVGDLHGALGTDDLAALVKELGVPTLKKLTDDLNAAQIQKLIAELGPRFKDIAVELGGKQLQQLVTELTGPVAKELIDKLGASGVKEIHAKWSVTGTKSLLDELTMAGVEEIGSKGLANIDKKLTPSEIKKWLDELGATKMRKVSEAYGGDAMKHYGKDWMKEYRGFTGDTTHHVTVGDGLNKKTGVSGCHDHDQFVTQFVNAAPKQIHVHGSPTTSGDLVHFDYSVMKADGSGPKAAHHDKTTMKGLQASWGVWQPKLEAAVDMTIKNSTFPKTPGAGPQVTVGGVKWSFYFRDSQIATIFPVM